MMIKEQKSVSIIFSPLSAGRAHNVHAPEPTAARGADIPQLPRQGGRAPAAPPQIQPPIRARLPTGMLCVVAVVFFILFFYLHGFMFADLLVCTTTLGRPDSSTERF